VKYIVLIARSLLSLFGIALVVLGILFWTGHALSLLPVHTALGGLFVICMWVLAVLGLLAPGTRGFALLVLVWSLIVPALGAAQLSLLPGSDHWVIQVVHLLVGIIAIGLGHSLARRLGRRPAGSAGVPETV
jgi:quinol-cytochrome oxidoreductase complex cytochrome b subunit